MRKEPFKWSSMIPAFSRAELPAPTDLTTLKSRLASMVVAMRLPFILRYKHLIRGLTELGSLLDYITPAEEESLILASGDLIVINEHLLQLLKCIDNFDARLRFATENQAKIRNEGELIKVLDLLAIEDRPVFVQANQAKIINESSSHTLENVLKRLKPEDRYFFAMQNLEKILGPYELGVLLRLMPPEARLDFVSANQDLISHNLAEVLHSLNSEDRFDFATANQDKINDGYSLSTVLNVLRPEDRLAFARANQAKIREDYQNLASVLPHLNPEDRFAFATVSQTMVSAYYANLAKANGRYWRPEDYSNLTSVLKHLSPNERVAFAIANQDKIEDILELVAVLGILSPASRLAFATANQAKIASGYFLGLDKILAHLNPDERVAFASAHQAKIMNGPELVAAVRIMPFEQRLAFVTANQAKISIPLYESSMLQLLALLNPEERLVFATTHQDRIKDAYELANVLNLLASELRLNFATANQDKIKDRYRANISIAFGSLLQHLNPEDRFAFATANQDKISGYYPSFDNLLTPLNPEDRFAFATANQAKITDVDQLVKVLSLLPDAHRLSFVRANQDKVKDFDNLVEILPHLSDEDCLAFATAHQDKVKDGNQLIKMLEFLSIETRLVFATANQAKIENVDQLIKVLACFPEEACLAFAIANQAKIMQIDEFDRIVLTFNPLLRSDQIDSFIQACSSDLRVSYLLREKGYSRSLFSDPALQQMIALQKVDANHFLFSAAVDPDRQADFEFFLSHTLCSADAVNDRSHDLVMHIEDQASLSSTIKAQRIAKIREQQLANCRDAATLNLGFNLASVKQTEAKFEGALPALEDAAWFVVGVDPALITHFRQLIQWLKIQAPLAAFQSNFSALEANTAIRANAVLFKNSIEALESFAATLAAHLQQRPAATTDEARASQAQALASHLDACDQLGYCAEGVHSALQSMTRSLNPGAAIANAVDIAIDQAIIVFIRLSGIRERMEVHGSKDRLSRLIGLDSRLRYDPYRLAISPNYLHAIARNAAGRLTADFLISQSLPFLESLQERVSLLLDSNELINLLERDWQVLYTSGLFTGKRMTSVDKCVDVMCFIQRGLSNADARRLIENYKAGNITQIIGRNLSAETLKFEYRAHLERSGVLTISSEKIEEIQAEIWSLLTTTSADLGPYDAVLTKLLNAPNGLAWIKSVIDSHSAAEQRQITLKALVHCPAGSSLNLFRALAADSYSAAWMMAWELERTESSLNFNASESKPLAKALSELVGDTHLMHREMEEIFVLPGNLLFWLGELQKDALHRATFESILGFISARNLYQYDNLLNVLSEMIAEGNELERTIASTFLIERCTQQKEQKLWSCYWMTLCYLRNPELNFSSREMLLSLMNPVNARAALTIAKSNHHLVLKLTEALAPRLISTEEFGAIMGVLHALCPVASPASELQVATVAGAAVGVGAGAEAEVIPSAAALRLSAGFSARVVGAAGPRFFSRVGIGGEGQGAGTLIRLRHVNDNSSSLSECGAGAVSRSRWSWRR